MSRDAVRSSFPSFVCVCFPPLISKASGPTEKVRNLPGVVGRGRGAIVFENQKFGPRAESAESNPHTSHDFLYMSTQFMAVLQDGHPNPCRRPPDVPICFKKITTPARLVLVAACFFFGSGPTPPRLPVFDKAPPGLLF